MATELKGESAVTTSALAVSDAGREALEDLVNFMELNRDRFALAFVYYDLPGQRDDIIVALRARLAGWNLSAMSLLDGDLSEPHYATAFVEQLRALADRAAGGARSTPCCFWTGTGALIRLSLMGTSRPRRGSGRSTWDATSWEPASHSRSLSS